MIASLLSVAFIGVVVILDALDGHIEDTGLAALVGAGLPLLGPPSDPALPVGQSHATEVALSAGGMQRTSHRRHSSRALG